MVYGLMDYKRSDKSSPIKSWINHAILTSVLTKLLSLKKKQYTFLKRNNMMISYSRKFLRYSMQVDAPFKKSNLSHVLT